MAEIVSNKELGKVIYCMFFPSIENEDKLVEFMKLAREELIFSIFAFTNQKLANAIFETVEKYHIKVILT